MRRTVYGLACGLMLLPLVAEVRADVAPFPFWRPRSPMQFGARVSAAPKPVAARVVIEASDRVRGARLQIPRKLLGTLQASAPASGGWRLPDVPTWSLALTLGLLLGGCALGLARARRPFAAAGVSLLLAAVALAGTQAVSAKQPLPPIPNFTMSGQIAVEVVEHGDTIRLTFGKNDTWPTRYHH